MIQALHHIGLSCGNLAQVSTFLQRAFAFTDLPGAGLGIAAAAQVALAADQTVRQSALLATPNGYLELLEFAPSPASALLPRPVNQAGITHFCVQAQAMAMLYNGCATAGATFHSDPVDLGTGWHYCYARDREANVIELEAAPFAPVDQTPWLAHVALATPDIGRLAAFYHHLLGGARLGGQKMGPNPRFDQITGLQNVELIPTWIVGANITLELWQFLTPPTTPPPQLRPLADLGYNHLCFEVADIATTLAACLTAGASQATPLDEHDGLATVYVRDPDGNLLELVEFAARRANLAIQQLPDHLIVSRIAALRASRATG